MPQRWHEQWRWTVWRPNRDQVAALPLGVRSVGWYDVASDWSECTMPKPFLELFWMRSGAARFSISRQSMLVEADHIFIYQPGERHIIQPVSSGCSYFWITFDHPRVRRWIKDLGFTGRVHSGGPCPDAIFHQIAEALCACTPEGEWRAANLAHELLSRLTLSSSADGADSVAVQIKSLIYKEYQNPLWDISATARKLGIHRTTVLRRFHAQYGISPAQYLRNLRIQKAMNLLYYTTMQVQDIAVAAGFADPNYLARSIREETGMSPREFRTR